MNVEERARKLHLILWNRKVTERKGVCFMNLTLNHEGYEANLVRTERMFSGIHYMFRFENNYGASVMKHYGSYGHQNDLWELAVIVFDEDGEWGLTYNTEITDDIVEYLTDEEVRTTLGKIKGL